ncbi:MAG: hypothetical protein AAF598_12965 [Bacteroidota bacterium]
MKSLLTLLCCCFLCLSYGQKEEAKEAVKAALYAMSENYNALGNSRDVNTVLHYYSPSYNAIRSSYKITGNLERKEVDYNSLQRLLNRIVSMESPVPNYEIEEIYDLNVQGQIAYAVIKAQFSLKDGDKLVARGTEMQTLVFQSIEEEWRIAQADILNLVDEQMRDNCGCTVFQAGANEFIARVQRPTGQQYEETLDQFTFQNLRDGNTQIYVNGKPFTWLTNKDLWLNYKDKEKRKMIGTAKTQKDVILLLLTDYLYKDYCRNILPNE